MISYGYDGKNFLSLDLKTETWIAPQQQAVITKHKWDQDKDFMAQTKGYVTQYFPYMAEEACELWEELSAENR